MNRSVTEDAINNEGIVAGALRECGSAAVR